MESVSPTHWSFAAFLAVSSASSRPAVVVSRPAEVKSTILPLASAFVSPSIASQVGSYSQTRLASFGGGRSRSVASLKRRCEGAIPGVLRGVSKEVTSKVGVRGGKLTAITELGFGLGSSYLV